MHPTTETEDEMEDQLLLDVVIRESTTILELFASENEVWLVVETFFILDLGLHVVDSVGGFLHPTTQTEDEMEDRLLLDVVNGRVRPRVVYQRK